jgi:hypothetical protein
MTNANAACRQCRQCRQYIALDQRSRMRVMASCISVLLPLVIFGARARTQSTYIAPPNDRERAALARPGYARSPVSVSTSLLVTCNMDFELLACGGPTRCVTRIVTFTRFWLYCLAATTVCATDRDLHPLLVVCCIVWLPPRCVPRIVTFTRFWLYCLAATTVRATDLDLHGHF